MAIRRNDQRRDLPRRAAGGGDRLRRRIGERRCGAHAADPSRNRCRERNDIGSERRVGADVPRRMVADQIDDRRARAPRVVQIRDAVGEARPKMQQRHRRLLRHPPVAVGRPVHTPSNNPRIARSPSAESSAATSGISVVPGICETHFDAGGDRGANQTLSSIHDSVLSRAMTFDLHEIVRRVLMPEPLPGLIDRPRLRVMPHHRGANPADMLSVERCIRWL